MDVRVAEAQQFDPALVPKIIAQLTQQRDQAMLQAAQAQVELDRIKAELEKLKAEHHDEAPK